MTTITKLNGQLHTHTHTETQSKKENDLEEKKKNDRIEEEKKWIKNYRTKSYDVFTHDIKHYIKKDTPLISGSSRFSITNLIQHQQKICLNLWDFGNFN